MGAVAVKKIGASALRRGASKAGAALREVLPALPRRVESEDEMDSRLIREARQESRGKKHYTLAEMRERYKA